jgi:hypothetical protein
MADNYHEFVHGFVKHCQDRGINDPGVIAGLLAEVQGDLQIKAAQQQLLTDQHVIEGFSLKCASVGIEDPAMVEYLLKEAGKQMDASKMYKNDCKKPPKGKTHLSRY